MAKHGGRALWLMVLLGLAGCGHDPPPEGYRLADKSCEDLSGRWMMDPADLAWLETHRQPPAGTVFPFLVIQSDRNALLELVARRRPADVLAEATTLGLTHPERYRAWRARLRGEPVGSHPINDGARDPVVELRWQLGTRDCRFGWRDAGMASDVTPRPGSEALPHIAALSLALGADGSLLMRRDIRKINYTGLSVSGKEFRWYSYVYSDWRRLAPLPDALLPALPDIAGLPDFPTGHERRMAESARQQKLSVFNFWFRARLPADVTITMLRERQFDPVALALPVNQMRVELAGHWPVGGEDPFTPLLQAYPGIGPIQIKQARLQANNRPYRMLEFTLTAD
ncbi:MAG: hypothetical protein DCF27_01235 [Lysobacteraceae bacterium]|nr:MAG: hypothetical protein DCF27_01235 [Xanthomonadaceae bacterium]